jgi:hypothetical protein
MEDGLIAANDNGLSWRRQILWRQADAIMLRAERYPAIREQALAYLKEKFGKLCEIESHSQHKPR